MKLNCLPQKRSIVHSTIAIIPLRIKVMHRQYVESLTSALWESTQIFTLRRTFFYWQTFWWISVATATEHTVSTQLTTIRHRDSHGTPCSNIWESSCNYSPTLTWSFSSNVASEVASVNAAIATPVQIIHMSLTTIQLRIRHTSRITT